MNFGSECLGKYGLLRSVPKCYRVSTSGQHQWGVQTPPRSLQDPLRAPPAWCSATLAVCDIDLLQNHVRGQSL